MAFLIGVFHIGSLACECSNASSACFIASMLMRTSSKTEFIQDGVDRLLGILAQGLVLAQVLGVNAY